MGQRYKNVYFPDYARGDGRKGSLTLAFGDKDRHVHEHIRPLSSHEVRELLGHRTFASVRETAAARGLSVNAYCLTRLGRATRQAEYGHEQTELPGFRESGPFSLDPIQATFRGGRAEPLHGWFPLVEGYSPQFVEQALRQFAPDAARVLDPFAGLGTTPLTVAGLGKWGFYCELNPLFQYLVDAKRHALALSEVERRASASSLRRQADRLEKQIAASEPDRWLRGACLRVFGAARFFDEGTYENVLRVRATIDALACDEPAVATFMTVAVLSSLVPASMLIRRGDLRFKTAAELGKGRVGFVQEIRRRMTCIADDLERLQPLPGLVTLVCADARDLAKVPPLDADALVTSPPYLNGTNYFRNTKIELWFLRCLSSPEELSRFRDKALTSGINDVRCGKAMGCVTKGVARIVGELQSCAYDRRIPQMVAAYFEDIRTVFGAARRHLEPGAAVVVDIGDSCYCGVHVPTDSLLAEVLADQGYALEQVVPLRKRMSRSGLALRQVLLVLRVPSARVREASVPYATQAPAWGRAWERFKAELPHQSGPYSKRNWGHPLHSLCSYQGKMKPSLASHLVEAFLRRGDAVLDPFGGVGTIPFEAALRGVRAWAFEISPAALHVARGKLGRADPSACEGVLQRLEGYIRGNRTRAADARAAAAIRFNKPLPCYFQARTLREVLLARRYFLDNPPADPSESLVLACLLHILHGNRPYALSRRSHPITPFAPTGPAEYRAVIPRLRDKVLRSLSAEYPHEFEAGEVLYQDATSTWPQTVGPLDAVITSPPFFDSTRFYLANWMRLWFCGWTAEDFKSRPLAFVDERQKASFDVYEPVFRQARERLKPGGVVVLHLGKSRKCDMAQALAQVAKRWFRISDVFSESVAHCESHGIRDKGTVAEHQYLILE